MSEVNYSIVEFFGGESDGHRCGYCKGLSGSQTDGMWAHSLTVQDYQDLIDRGWRRSGCYCYKPKMNITCCPLYTIRCEVLNFQLSKSQKKVLKKVQKFLSEGSPKKEQTNEKQTNETISNEQLLMGQVDFPDLCIKDQAHIVNLDKKEIRTDIQMDTKKDSIKKQETQIELKTTEATTSTKHCPAGSVYAPPKKAKLMRKERRLEKLKSKGVDPSQLLPAQLPQIKTLEQHLQSPGNALHCLELRLVQSCPPSEEFQRTAKESFDVYKKYQVQIHQDDPVTVTNKTYTRFLVNSPLEQEYRSDVIFGSYHQQYWLDGKLIAVGVIDILPYCVSSVYFYYDPDYSFLSLGTYAALREIAFTRELHLKDPTLKYYYMGYYIHSCPKMIYKGQYTPSKLLCPVSYTWHPIEHCRTLLAASKYCSFSDQTSEEDVDVNQVKILHKRTVMTYYHYAQRKPEAAQSELEEVKKYAKLVGPKCSRNMLLYRS